MYSFGKKSKDKLKTLHPDLKLILKEAIKVYDISIISGIRTQEEQQELFKSGRSKLDGINKKSKHQGKEYNGSIVSFAVDVIPYKKGTNAFSGKEKDNRRFYFLMGMIKIIANNLLASGLITHNVRFGLDWDGDDVYTDQNFDDLPHIELVKNNSEIV